MRPDQPAVPARPARTSRRRSAATAVGAVAFVAAMTVGAAPPAAAAPPPIPIVDCVLVQPNGSFRAVFGYYYGGPSSVTIPYGPYNYAWPSDLTGSLPTTFEPGPHQGAFATPLQPKNAKVTWVIAGWGSTASWRTTRCGPDVVLPTEGNGMGPILVLGLSMILSFLPVALRNRWRKRRA